MARQTPNWVRSETASLRGSSDASIAGEEMPTASRGRARVSQLSALALLHHQLPSFVGAVCGHPPGLIVAPKHGPRSTRYLTTSLGQRGLEGRVVVEDV